MPKKVVLSVGTKRGLFLAESSTGRKKWSVRGPYLKGWSVPYAFVDTRSAAPRIHASASHYTFGSNTFSSAFSGKKFTPAEKPIEYPELNPKSKKFVDEWGLPTRSRCGSSRPVPRSSERPRRCPERTA